MATVINRKPIVFIVGPTASGKSSVAMEVAQKHDGEIICADSRTIYKYMDVGTAKPTLNDQETVPHWGLDLVEPGDKFSAADFQSYAKVKIDEIHNRGHIPIIVGGTGLYVDGLLFDYEFGGTNIELRTRLEAMTLEELQQYCEENGIKMPENRRNKRYVIRAIEQGGINNNRKLTPLENAIVVGISTEKNILRTRIMSRIEQLFDDGVVEEARILGEKYGWESEAMTGDVYRVVRRYLDGEISLEQAKELNFYADWHLAKRQITWLKRNTYIHWTSLEDAVSYISGQLAMAHKS